MNRTALLAGLGALVITGGVAVAAPRPSDRPVLLTSDATDEPTTTSTAPEVTTTGVTYLVPPTTGTSIPSWATTIPPTTETTAAPAPPETTIPPEPPETWNTTIPPEPSTAPPETTTSTTAPARPGQYAIHLECGDIDEGIVCEWGDVPEGTTQLAMMREHEGPSQEIDRTDDTSVRRYVDETAEPGVSYAYRVSAYAADGRFLGTSNPIRLTHGDPGGGTDS